MSTKDSKTFDKMMKKFFSSLYKNTPGSLRRQEDFVLSLESLEKELSPETPIAQRVKTLKDLTKTDNITSCSIDDHVVARLWEYLKDLLDPTVPKESRHVVFHFFGALIFEKHEKINVMRSQFFKFIKSHNIPEDIGPRLELFQSLTNCGKFLLTFEEEVGIFLLEWMPEIIDAGKTHDFLQILVNVIKYNAAFIEGNVVTGLVQSTCNVCCQSPDDNIVYSSLEVLHTVVCYPSLPLEALPPFIATLCRTVNIERYCPTSWKIMKNLLGTHLGHSSLFTMCRLLQDENSLADVGLLRGAVFYINMALWGNHRVSALKCTPSSVLPAFQAALACKHSRVMYEVILSIQRLVNKHGHELLDPAWYVILTIIDLILQHLDEKNKTENKDIPCLDLVLTHVHETLNLIEQLIEVGQFNGCVQKVFRIIEQCSSSRPEASVLRLLSHLSSEIDPRKDEWLEHLNTLMHRFFRHESRPNIRIKVLSILSSVIKNNGLIYEEEIIVVVKNYLFEVGYDPDLAVRVAASHLLFDLCLTCQSHRVVILMDIMEQMVFRVFKIKEGVESEETAADVKRCAYSLVEVFKQFLYHWDPSPSLKAFTLITTHLKHHYTNVSFLSNATSIRLMMLECMLELRADKHYRIGLKNKHRYSMYVVSSSGAQSSHDRDRLHVLPVHMAVEAIVSSIKSELDWKILLLVLQELPHLLKNKALLISKNSSEVHQIATALCAMVCDKNVCSPDRLNNTPPKFTRSDLHSYVFPVLASLVSYHVHLEPTLQQRIIKCFEYGLATKSAGLCVLALTLCTLEMRDAMVKLLPEVLLSLSKISATVTTAIPILEFLSTLTQLPSVFANFVGDQYMSVFAIALPYTNLFKYTHYTVSLAHHVIAAWFLKCRLPFRRDFVKFITNHLKGNLIPPSEEGSLKLDMVNEDSSNRKRSSSLTEQGSRRRERPSRMELKSSPHDDSMSSFHRELTETCFDLMAMYSFLNVSPITKRQRTAETILQEGQSMTWLVGNKVITVTTSGCTLKALKHGLCDRCLKRCRIETDQVSSPSADSIDDKKKTFTHPDTKANNNSKTGENEDNQSTDSQDLISTKLDLNDKKERLVCACWCQGWAEIHIRRPTGTMSWMMRIQNETEGGGHSLSDLSHCDISSLFLPNQTCNVSALKDLVSERVCSEPVSIPGSPVRRNSLYTDLDDIEFEVNGKSRNPVRRSNSSPEMSASWKSPLALENENSNEVKKKQNYNKDHRLNCEAIPEEMGTTPPTCEALMLASMDHVETKPPVPISPRIYKGDDIGRTSKGGGYRERGHTISVMSPIRKPSHWDHRPNSPRTKESIRSGVNPAFVFLQLYYSTHFGQMDKKPILLPSTVCLEHLDWIPPYEVHKIGVLYVGPGQANSEAEILRNQYGSVRYAEFLQRLGTLISLKEADRQHIYLGGLEVDGNDGKFAYIWHDDVMQVVFHVATLMPNVPNDPNGNGKKRHVGNNLVTIVYNDSGEEYNYQTVKAQFNFAVVIVEPLDFGTNVVRIKAKEELIQQLCHNEYKIVSDQSAAVLARQLAIHTNLAALILSPLNQSRGPYASHWLERLRWIKRTQAKVEANADSDSRSTARLLHSKRSTWIDEFTDYT